MVSVNGVASFVIVNDIVSDIVLLLALSLLFMVLFIAILTNIIVALGYIIILLRTRGIKEGKMKGRRGGERQQKVTISS